MKTKFKKGDLVYHPKWDKLLIIVKKSDIVPWLDVYLCEGFTKRKRGNYFAEYFILIQRGAFK